MIRNKITKSVYRFFRYYVYKCFLFVKTEKRLSFHCTKNSKRCFNNPASINYKYEYFGLNTPICCATHLYEILSDIIKVCEKYNIVYFASFGTLLGIVRHSGLIPWDTDVDILISETEKNRLYQLLQSELSDKYQIQEDEENGIYGSLLRVNYSSVNNLHVDIYTFLESEESVLFGASRHFSYDDIFPLITLPFYDIEVKVPNKAKAHLIYLYGKKCLTHSFKKWEYSPKESVLVDFSPAELDKSII